MAIHHPPSPKVSLRDKKREFARMLEKLLVARELIMSRRQCRVLLERFIPSPQADQIDDPAKVKAARSDLVRQAINENLHDCVEKLPCKVMDVVRFRIGFNWAWGDELDANRIHDFAHQLVRQGQALRERELEQRHTDQECAVFMSSKFRRIMKEHGRGDLLLARQLWNSQAFLQFGLQSSGESPNWAISFRQQQPNADDYKYLQGMRTISTTGGIISQADGTQICYFVGGFLLGCAHFHAVHELKCHNAWFTRIPQNKALRGYVILIPDLFKWEPPPPMDERPPYRHGRSDDPC